MDNPTRSMAETIADQIAEIEAARNLAEVRLAALTEICRRFIGNLSGAIDALHEDDDPAQLAQDAAPASVPAAPTAEPRPSREDSRRRNDAIDTAVLSILTESRGSEVTVATISGRLMVEGMSATGRDVSMSLQRLLKSNADVRPGAKKGYWTVVAPTPTPENGTLAAQEIAEPEDDASALEEGVVRGDAWPSPDGPDEYARF